MDSRAIPLGILGIVLRSEQSTGINPSSISGFEDVYFGVDGRPIRKARPSSSESNYGEPTLIQKRDAHRATPSPLWGHLLLRFDGGLASVGSQLLTPQVPNWSHLEPCRARSLMLTH